MWLVVRLTSYCTLSAGMLCEIQTKLRKRISPRIESQNACTLGSCRRRATDVASPPGSSHPDAVPDSTRVCRAQRVRPARPSVGPPGEIRRGLQHKRRGPNVSRPLPLAAGNGRGGGQRRCCSQRQLQRCIRHALLAWPEGRMHSYSV